MHQQLRRTGMHVCAVGVQAKQAISPAILVGVKCAHVYNTNYIIAHGTKGRCILDGAVDLVQDL